MKRTIKITESQLSDLIKKVLKEQDSDTDRYMFFSNLEQIHRQTGKLLEQDHEYIHQVLENGHDWAQDHIATAKESIDQVFDFFMNDIKGSGDEMQHDDEIMVHPSMMEEGKKKAGTKLCARGKAAAKAKFKVFPSAYSNGFGVQVCQGKKAGLDGKKKCSPPYC